MFNFNSNSILSALNLVFSLRGCVDFVSFFPCLKDRQGSVLTTPGVNECVPYKDGGVIVIVVVLVMCVSPFKPSRLTRLSGKTSTFSLSITKHKIQGSKNTITNNKQHNQKQHNLHKNIQNISLNTFFILLYVRHILLLIGWYFLSVTE